MIAIIDIGSNSVRLHLEKDKFHKTIATTRLAQGLSLSGALEDAAMERTLDAVEQFVQTAKKSGMSATLIFATEAVRAATNGAQFCRAVHERTGIIVDVLTPEQEAMCGFLGAAQGYSGDIAVIDIGGASVEISVGHAEQKTLTYSKSLAIGMVRLQDLYGSDQTKLRRYLKSQLLDYGTVRAANFIGIGGTFTSVAAMASQATDYEPQKIHGYNITRQDVERLSAEIWDMTIHDRIIRYPTLDPKRAQIIGHGLVLISEMMDYLKINDIKASESDNIEGYRHELARKHNKTS